MIEQMTKALAEVKIEAFSMDLANAEYRELQTGEPYALIPTETVMDAADNGQFKATSQTLALIDEGEWYLLRVNEDRAGRRSCVRFIRNLLASSSTAVRWRL